MSEIEIAPNQQTTNFQGAPKSWEEEVLGWLSIPKDLRFPKTVVELCDKLEIRRDEYYTMVGKPEFQKKLLERMVSRARESAPEVFDRLLQNAKEGETKAIELYLKYVLEIAEKFEHTGNMKGFTLNIIQANKIDGGNMDANGQADTSVAVPNR